MDLALAPASDMRTGRHDALDRRRRRGRARHRADRRARLPRSRAVSRRARFDALGTAPGHLHAARGQVDLAPGGAVRRDVRRAGGGAQLPRVGRHRVHAERPAEPRGRAWTRTATASVLIRGVGLHAPLEATGGLLDVGNSRHADAPAARLARRAAREGLDARRRRVDPAAGRWTGWPSRSQRWAPAWRPATGRFPPFTVSGAELAGIEYRAAGGERPGQVLRADRRHAGRRLDHGRRAGAEPRPHRAA